MPRYLKGGAVGMLVALCTMVLAAAWFGLKETVDGYGLKWLITPVTHPDDPARFNRLTELIFAHFAIVTGREAFSAMPFLVLGGLLGVFVVRFWDSWKSLSGFLRKPSQADKS